MAAPIGSASFAVDRSSRSELAYAMMFKRIVVGTDGSPTARAAVAHAIALAKELGAALDIVCAYPSAASLTAMAVDPVGATIGVSAAAVEDDLRAEAESIVRDARNEAGNAGLAAETHPVSGDASDAILDIAEGVDADLIVLGN